MPKFRKKPVVIEAEQWVPGVEMPGVYRSVTLGSLSVDDFLHPLGWIDTLEGTMRVSPGDWVITGVNGEKYPCKPDVFAKTYDPVED